MTDYPATPKMNSPAPKDGRHSQKIRYGIVITLILLLLSPFLIATLFEIPGPLKENKTIVIPHGTSTHEIGEILNNNGVVYDATLFTLASRIIANNALKAGEYQFIPNQSLSDIVLMIHDGKSVIHMFTVAEGLTSSEIVHLLRNSPALAGDITTIPPEGTLLPETYRYSYGDTRSGMINRMQKSMQDLIHELWTSHDPSLPLKTPEEAIIMASVIEKETGKPVERPRIAGVFYNRLHINMRLQSDPTVIYALTQGKGPLDRDLTHEDLSFSSPINTYASDGLPSQPICNPGRAALEAALHPETNNYLYFVADGTGGHAFSRDLNEHNQNVTKLRAQKN